MATPAQCPHDNPPVTGDGPYYRQVHPRNSQDGRVISPAFTLQETECHLTLSLNDGARTTPERCHREYTGHAQRLSAAVMALTAQELEESGAEYIVDSPNDQTHAHVDAVYPWPMNRRQRRQAAQTLTRAANRKGPVYLPKGQ